MNQSSSLPQVILVDDHDHFTSNAIAALGDHIEQLGEFATVGGLALHIRLSAVHRLTVDVDAVSPNRDQVVELLVASGAEMQSRSVLLNAGVSLDIIDVPSPITESSDPLMAARRWGLEHSSLVEVGVTGSNPVSAVLPVSEPAALVAMKVHALDVRTDPLKRVTDVVDIAALALHCRPADLARDLASAPGPLPASTMGLLHKAFVTHVDVHHTRSRLHASAKGIEPLNRVQIERVGDILTEMRSRGVALPDLPGQDSPDRSIDR